MAVEIKITEDNATEVYRYLRDAIAWYGAEFFTVPGDEPSSVTKSRAMAALQDWQGIDPACMQMPEAPFVLGLQRWIDLYLPAKKISRLKAAIKMNRNYARKREARSAVKLTSP